MRKVAKKKRLTDKCEDEEIIGLICDGRLNAY